MGKLGMTSLALVFLSCIGLAAVAAYELSGTDAANGLGQGTIAPASRYQSPQITQADVKLGPAPRADGLDRRKTHSTPAIDRKDLRAAVDKGVAKSAAAEGIRLSNGRSSWGHENEALLGGTVVADKLPR